MNDNIRKKLYLSFYNNINYKIENNKYYNCYALKTNEELTKKTLIKKRVESVF